MNGNAFQAQWLSQIGREDPYREYGTAINIALWHLRGALDPNIVGSALAFGRIEPWIPGAAQWILIAGREVFKLCEDNKLNDGTPLNVYWLCDEGVDGYGWLCNEGFSVERWSFWRSRFRYVASLKGVKLSVSQLATRRLLRGTKLRIVGRCKEKLKKGTAVSLPNSQRLNTTSKFIGHRRN